MLDVKCDYMTYRQMRNDLIGSINQFDPEPTEFDSEWTQFVLKWTQFEFDFDSVLTLNATLVLIVILILTSISSLIGVCLLF